MRRLASIILVLTFLAMGSGITQYAHEWQHAQQDAATGGVPCKPLQQHPIHNDLNCEIHAQLHMPITVVAWLPPAIEIGILAIAAFAPDRAVISQNDPDRIDCRGPPVA